MRIPSPERATVTFEELQGDGLLITIYDLERDDGQLIAVQIAVPPEQNPFTEANMKILEDSSKETKDLLKGLDIKNMKWGVS